MKNFFKFMLSVAFVFFTFGAFAQPAAAPTAPDKPVSNVISIYGTDTYTPITGVDAFPDWGQTAQGSTIGDYTISGTDHKVLKYGNLSFQGIDFSGNAQDVSDMKYLHLDIWTEDAASSPLWVAIISGSQNIALEKTITTDGSWFSLDIPLSEYVGATLTSINQIMFTSAEWRTYATNDSSVTIYLDNIYFWTDVTASVVLSTAQLSVDADEGSTGTFDITSSNTWTVASDQAWLTPDVASGSGDATITLTATANAELAERTATVTVTGHDDSFKTVKVTQSGVPVSDPIAPTAAAEDVKAIFSDPYTPLAVTFENWFGTTITDETSTTAANNVKKVTSECCFGYTFSTAADLSAMQKMHIDIYPTTITSITLGIVANGEHKKTITLTPDEWNPIEITLSELTTVENLAAVAQVGFWDLAGTFYMDNLYFYKEESVADDEAPTDFTAVAGTITYESVELLLNATDNSGSVIYKVSYGDGPTVETANGASGVEKSYVVTGLAASTEYSFTVTAEDASGNKTSEIVVPATTAVSNINQPAAAPTAPDEPVSNVISIYGTDTYTPITGVDAFPDWGQTAQGSTIGDYTIPGTDHKVLKYGKLSFQGIDFSGNAQDVSDMKYLHLDIWTEDAASSPLWVAIISGSQNIAVEKTITTDGSWFSLDIPLSEYIGATLTSINQIMFTSAEWRTTATNTSSATIYLDNIYFWTDVSAAVVLSTAQLTVDADEGSTGTFDITSSDTWTVASDSAWLTPDVTSGSGDATITLTANANTVLSERTTTVTVTGSDDSFKTVKVTQRGIPVSDPIAPTAAAEDVKAIFSDPYTPLAVTFENWFGTTITDETSTTAANNVKKVTSECCFGYTFSTPADLSEMDILHIDIYPTTITSITIGVVASGEHKQTISLTPNVWNPIDITLSDLTTVENLASVAQVGFWELTGTFYMDNLYFRKAGAVSDTEAPTAFTATKGEVTSEGIELLLNATDNSGAVIYKVSYGEGPTVTTVNGVSGVEKSYVVMGLEPYTNYSFSITAQDVAGNTAANNPVVVDATTAGLPAPAPVPDIAEARVISVYSDSYTDLPNTNYPIWEGQTTRVVDVTLGTNNAQKYTTFNYTGIELASSLDASEMDTLHVDIYTEYETKIKITPVSPDAEFPIELAPLTAGQWNSYDIALSDFTGVDPSAIVQFKLDGGTGKTFYLDNLFLYKEPDTEAPTTFSAVTGTITSESVELLLNATDNSSDITYTISYGDTPTVLTTSGESGVETSFVVSGLEASTVYSFTVTAEDAFGNKASEIVVPATTAEAPTGINVANHSNFRIYPNPVESDLFIDDLSVDASLKIYSITGELLIEKQNVSNGINVENLPKGAYFIQILDNQSIITRKFIKK